jgi:hypothetical protein
VGLQALAVSRSLNTNAMLPTRSRSTSCGASHVARALADCFPLPLRLRMEVWSSEIREIG